VVAFNWYFESSIKQKKTTAVVSENYVQGSFRIHPYVTRGYSQVANATDLSPLLS
jgi:hypothetical protein